MVSRAVRSKILITAVAVGGFASVAGLGTFGAFTSTTAANASYSSGMVEIALGATGASTNRLNVGASNLVPGDTIQRSEDLINRSTAALPVTLTTTANPSSALDTDTTNGLQLTVRSCDVAWSTTLVGGAPVYSCSGTARTLAAGPVAGNRVLATPASLAVGGVDHLAVSVALPEGAGNTFQGARSRMALTFTGTQATGTTR